MSGAPRVTWPAERFYWAALEAPGWRRAGPLPDGLREAAADELPGPADDLFAVCTPARDGTVLVCAAPRAALASLDAATEALTPTALPEFADATCAPAAFNLLVGEFEPGAVRRARNRTRGLIASSIALCALVVSFGLHRRTEAWRAGAERANAAAREVTGSALPAGGELRAEIERLRRAARIDGQRGKPADASLVLASVLAGWPAQVPCVTHSIAVGENGANLSLAVEGDPTPFLEAIRPPPGWVLDEPRLNAADGKTRVSLRLRPEREASP